MPFGYAAFNALASCQRRDNATRSARVANIAGAESARGARAKSVQQHIDELPNWADGTSLRSTPMTSMQWLIWGLAAAGKFFEGFVVFMTGVALPLFSNEFNLGAAE